MDKKELKKRKKKRIRLIKSLVLVLAFVVAIGATAGVTMSYFGGQSNPFGYDMILKTGLYLNTPTQTEVQKSMYVVPSQIVTANCQFSVSSRSADGKTINTGDSASDGLVRAIITFGNTEISGATLTGSSKQAYFPVYMQSDTEKKTVVANFVKFTDGNYYLMTGNTIGTTDTMYIVDASAGEQKFTFDLRVAVPASLTNSDGGKKVTLSVVYQVVQSDFFNTTTGDQITQTPANAKLIFDDATIKDKTQTY